MAKIYNSFIFVGTFDLMKDRETKQKIGVREIKPKDTKSTWVGKEISFIVKSDNQSQICKLFGGADSKGVIKTYSVNKDEATGKSVNLEIPFSKRLDPDIVSKVAGFKKTKVLDKEFITEYDAVDYVGTNIALFEGKRVKVYGNVKFEIYNGKIYPKFMVTALYEAKEVDKDGFDGNMAMFINADTLDSTYVKANKFNVDKAIEDKKIPLSIYVEEYNSDKETNKDRKYNYVPVTVFLNISDKFDKTNPTHVSKLSMLAETFIPKSKSKIYEMGYGVRFFRGSEETPITMDDLTDFEKRKIELGYVTLEELTKSKQGMSEKRNEIQVKMNFNDKYVDGVEETELKDEDLCVLDVVTTEEVKVDAKATVVKDEDLF